jgi:hypothetical protein
VYELDTTDIMGDSSNSNVQKAEELKLRANDAFKGKDMCYLPVVCLECTTLFYRLIVVNGALPLYSLRSFLLCV